MEQLNQAKKCNVKSCKRINTTATTKCSYHLENRRNWERTFKESRLSQGLCWRCAKPLDNSTDLCTECKAKKYAKEQVKREARTEAGLCYICRAPTSFGTRCEDCMDKVTKRQEDRLAIGNCWQCDQPRLEANNLHCMDCWLKEKSRMVLGTAKNYLKLKDLWRDQKGCCAYTGVPLKAGGPNTHLDHIVPKSRGGKDTIENLQWVERRINLLKDTQTHEEFVASIPELRDLLLKIEEKYAPLIT